jgi:hypothetical protein
MPSTSAEASIPLRHSAHLAILLQRQHLAAAQRRHKGSGGAKAQCKRGVQSLGGHGYPLFAIFYDRLRWSQANLTIAP